MKRITPLQVEDTLIDMGSRLYAYMRDAEVLLLDLAVLHKNMVDAKLLPNGRKRKALVKKWSSNSLVQKKRKSSAIKPSGVRKALQDLSAGAVGLRRASDFLFFESIGLQLQMEKDGLIPNGKKGNARGS